MTAVKKILSTILVLFCLTNILFLVDAFNASTETSAAYAVATDTYEQRAESGSEGDTYYHFNPAKIFDTSGKSETDGGIMGGFVGIIDFIITKIFLPLGIVLSTWRIVYLAIFPLIMGADPLKIMSLPRYSDVSGKKDTYSESQGVWESQQRTFGTAGLFGHGYSEADNATTQMKRPKVSQSYADMVGGNRNSTKALNYIKQEVKFVAFGLLLTFIAWGLVELLLKVAVFALNVADTASSSAVN